MLCFHFFFPFVFLPILLLPIFATLLYISKKCKSIKQSKKNKYINLYIFSKLTFLIYDLSNFYKFDGNEHML